MHRYILRRLMLLIPVMLGVVFIVFTMMYMTPGDPARIMLGESAPAEAVARLRAEMGLDDPFVTQFVRYVTNLLQGDIGRSYRSNRPVMTEIMARFPVTMKLASLGAVVAITIGIPAGIISATKQYSIFDNITMLVALFGVSMPAFWQGLMMILIFSVQLKWFPSSGFSDFKSMVLPAITVGTTSVAIVTRMTRSSVLEVIRQDYIRTAKAKGLSPAKVIIVHTLKNALIPILTVIGLQFGFLLGGAVLTENIYSIPGLGRLMVESIRAKDYPIVQGGVLVIAMAFSIVNLIVDILYAFVDPRIRSQYK